MILDWAEVAIAKNGGTNYSFNYQNRKQSCSEAGAERIPVAVKFSLSITTKCMDEEISSRVRLFQIETSKEIHREQHLNPNRSNIIILDKILAEIPGIED